VGQIEVHRVHKLKYIIQATTDNFGLRIGVEGEKDFKNALRDINQSFKVLVSEMNLATSQFDKQDNSIHAIIARNEAFEECLKGTSPNKLHKHLFGKKAN
jgi:phage-related minor tail protein